MEVPSMISINFSQFNFSLTMKTHLAQTGIEFFFHRYLIDSKKINPEKRKKFQNEQDFTFTNSQTSHNKTSLHKCRMVRIGEENLEEWPLYLLKRISYVNDKKQRKGKMYQVYDQHIKKISQIRTEYLSYQIMNKSHRVVRMIQLINENPKKDEDNRLFYKFFGRKKNPSILNACFILQLCNDGTLEDKLNNYRHAITQDKTITYASQILEGLIELKKKGILHRDLRPCNIFLHNDEVKFGDFDSAFIYKESQCTDIKSGIDINTTPQEIVELASLSDKELQEIGNLKLFELQAKCDIYFFGMILFKMVFRRDYEKKFQGTDIDYLIREKVKDGFSCPQLLEVMKRCLYTNVEKRMDLLTLFDQMKAIERERYFAPDSLHRTYLSSDPLDLFSFSSLQPIEPQLNSQIQNSISHTFTVSFDSVEYNFQNDFQKARSKRQTSLYVDEVQRVHSKYYKTHENSNLWNIDIRKRKKLDSFLQIMEDFATQMSTRAFYYDYLYKVILKINTKSITKKQQKSIITTNKTMMEKEIVIILKFLFQILARTPFKIDKNYCSQNLPYETRKIFMDKVKINDKFNFFNGRSKTFNYEEFQTYQMIQKFFSIEYDDADSDNFQVIHENLLYMIGMVDKRFKCLLSSSIVDLFRPYDSCRKAKTSQLKEILFIMIALEKLDLQNIKKSNIVMMKNLLEPLFNDQAFLQTDEAELFFDNYKSLHQKQVQQSKKKEHMQISMNLLSISKKHLDCIFNFMKKAQNQPEKTGNEEVRISEPKEVGKSTGVKFSAEYEVIGEEKARNYYDQDVGKLKKRVNNMEVLEDERLSDCTDQMQISRGPIQA